MFKRKVSFILIVAIIICCLTDVTKSVAAEISGDRTLDVSTGATTKFQVYYGSTGAFKINADSLVIDTDDLYHYNEHRNAANRVVKATPFFATAKPVYTTAKPISVVATSGSVRATPTATAKPVSVAATTATPNSTAMATPTATPDPKKVARTVFTTEDSDILKVDTNGFYEAIALGTADLEVTGYNAYGDELFDKNFAIEVTLDATQASLSQTSFTTYKMSDSYGESSVTMRINGVKGIDQCKNLNAQLSCESSNDDMYVRSSIEGDKITLTTYSVGTTKVTLSLYEKTFVVTWNVKEVKLKGDASFLLVKGKTKQLTLTGYSGKLNWESSNKKVVSVTAKGKIKAKKIGSAVVKTKIGSSYVGCIVSVVTKGRVKVINKAVWIAKNWKYSQEKRMQSGYYDCSALVWKSYTCEGRYLLGKYGAPTAASLAQWCASHNKIIKSSRKKLKNLEIQPGAVIFKTGADNGRFKGIYHVEMFVGYRLTGFDSKGKPYLVGKWASKYDGYGDGETYWAQF